ncbi:MAG: rhodanese-like domain-containing protein [Cycloclasticus sp.]|nr:rhodanese-like domain-containing protein [Cycloclasticus sp.]MBQ0789088.1 rhodanese-like domain-containing protein [Cycloclasticus sp.]
MSTIKSISPTQAHEILQGDSSTQLIDTRTSIEYSFIGHPIGAIHVPLKRPPEWLAFPDFIEKVASHVADTTTPIILMCRSGARSMAAAELLAEAGYKSLYNMDEGFEGDKDHNNHRGNIGGWRFHGLPWEQS